MKRILLLAIGIAAVLQNFAQIRKADKETDYPRHLRLEQPVPITQTQTLFRSSFNLTSTDELRLVKTETDPLGYVHEKYQQYYRGFRVEGFFYTTHSRNKQIQSLSGMYRGIKDLATTPSISEKTALNTILNKLKGKKYAWEEEVKLNYPDYTFPKGELVIFADLERKLAATLAYKFDIFMVDPLYRAFVYVDATTGKIIMENSIIHHANVPATAQTHYNGIQNITADLLGTTYRLRENTNGTAIETFSLGNSNSYFTATDITSASPVFESDPVANQAHWGAEKTYEFYFSKFNRRSFNNLGSPIRSYVHYLTGYTNAFWDGTRMTYGDGDGINSGPWVSIDMIGHEITHGVTQNSAGLLYQRESGALNESFSDIFGEAIEYYTTGTYDWLCGARIKLPNGNGPNRSMKDPNLYGQPDTYQQFLWSPTDCGAIPSIDNDFCGVHINSGVQNKWFYILTDGEAGTNDLGNTYNVTGIGMEKAINIAYRTLAFYLAPGAGYFDAKAASVQAARDLYGQGSPEEIAVINAWYAVGVGGQDCNGCLVYCSAGGINAQSEWIRSVTIGSFVNTSGSAGYTDFTDKIITLAPGSANSITLSPGFPTPTSDFGQAWGIWIDFNKDGDFTDAGETVYNRAASTISVFGTITIPDTASGTTRMRVSMKFATVPQPCEKFPNGETEDYTVRFGIPDTIPPAAPLLRATNIMKESAQLLWTSSSDNIGVTGYDVFVDGIKIITTTDTSYLLTGLNTATTYSIQVTALDAAGNRSASNTLSLTTQSDQTILLASYFETGFDRWQDGGDDCARVRTNRSYEGNFSVMLRNNSGIASSMTSPSLNVVGFNSLTIDFYFDGRSIDKGKEFVVYYQNGQRWQKLAKFESGKDFSGRNFFHASVAVLSNNFPANTRFRIQSEAGGSKNQVFIDQVTIIAANTTDPIIGTSVFKTCEAVGATVATAFAETVNTATPALYPNPARDHIKLSVTGTVKQVSIFNTNGVLVKRVGISGNQSIIDIQSLSAGLYLAIIETSQGKIIQKFVKQ